MGFVYTQHLDISEYIEEHNDMVLVCNRCCNHLLVFEDTFHNGSYSIVGSIVNCNVAQELESLNDLKIKRIYCNVCLSLLGFKVEQLQLETPEFVSVDVSSVEYKVFKNKLVDAENSLNYKKYSAKYHSLLRVYKDLIGKYCFNLKLSRPVPLS